MLTRLYISNYALIDFLEIQCKAGLTSITGETGAGKSIILGALSLVLGKRADTSVLKNSEQKSIIEIEIHIQNQHCKPLFTLYDVDFLPQTTLRREITPQGKSRAFINDTTQCAFRPAWPGRRAVGDRRAPPAAAQAERVSGARTRRGRASPRRFRAASRDSSS